MTEPEEADALVGRTPGATPPDVVVDAEARVLLSGGQVGEPQARSVGQQPPPWLAGQELKPGEQVSVDAAMTVDGAAEVEGVLHPPHEEEDGAGEGVLHPLHDADVVGAGAGMTMVLVEELVEELGETVYGLLA